MLDTRPPISDETVKIYIVNTRWGVRLQDLKEQTPGAFLQFINGDLVKRIGRFKKNRRLDFGDCWEWGRKGAVMPWVELVEMGLHEIHFILKANS